MKRKTWTVVQHIGYGTWYVRGDYGNGGGSYIYAGAFKLAAVVRAWWRNLRGVQP